MTIQRRVMPHWIELAQAVAFSDSNIVACVAIDDRTHENFVVEKGSTGSTTKNTRIDPSLSPLSARLPLVSRALLTNGVRAKALSSKVGEPTLERSYSPGRPFPQGATWDGAGVNFAIYSTASDSVELCLFDRADHAQ